MPDKLYLDSTWITTWLTCREMARRRYVENIVLRSPSIHLAFGHAVHIAVEAFWKGYKYEEALGLAASDMQEFPENLLPPPDAEKWREMASSLVDMVACYFDSVTFVEGCEVEAEFSAPWNDTVVLCGKIDRFNAATGELADVKTASEIGRTWKSDYKDYLLRQFQFGFYDWYLRTQDKTPKKVTVECLVKPYKGKESRLELFPLPEIMAYRKRFDHLLRMTLEEIEGYWRGRREARPWPMAGSAACQHKFGACDYLQLCNHGEKYLDRYVQRKEHLHVIAEMSVSG